MAGEKLASLMLKAGRQAIPNSEKTDLLYGKVLSVSPLRIQVANEPKLILTESFLILSDLCREKKVQILLPDSTGGTPVEVALWRGLAVGDSVSMLRVLRGSKFYVLQKEVE